MALQDDRQHLAAGGDARRVPTAALLAVVMDSEARAARLLAHCDGNGLALTSLAQTPAGQRRQWSGMTEAQAARLEAALELGRRLHAPAHLPPVFTAPAEVARYLTAHHGNPAVEEFGFLALSSRNAVIRDEVVSRGSLTGAPVHPRDLFRRVIAVGAAGVILWHNHPSGDPEPSQADRQLTRRLSECGALMGIPVLDHIVIGAGRFYSFSEKGDL